MKLSNTIRKIKNTSCSVVIVAGGSSSRMGQNKLLMDLLGRPVIVRTIQAFQNCSFVDEIILVSRADDLETMAQLREKYLLTKIKKIVVGGSNRNQSALNGLSEISRNAKIVLIHDGARPLVTETIIYDVMHKAALYKCAAPAIPVTDTVKEVEKDEVVKTLPRDSLMAIQTPQAFVPEIIKAALTLAIQTNKEYTDDCAAVEAMGIPVYLSSGSQANIKITRPIDIITATALINNHE